MDSWQHAYEVTIPILALSFLIRVIMFLILMPKGFLEWATTLAAIGTVAFFGTLAYWLYASPPAPDPIIYPPLVVAAMLATVGSVIFTIASLNSWRERRKP